MSSSSDHRGLSLNKSRLEGKQFGPYLIQTLIAEGGMGSVYMAYHQGLQRQVALKTLLDHASPGSAAVERFLTEARVVAKIQHPNVVPVYDAGELAGVRYMAMEFVPGKTLAERLHDTGVLDAPEAAALTRDIASGLQAAHVLRILHRDVKPSNVILSGDGARLTDFGIARVEGSDRRLTKSGSVLGTPNYMAPEQAQDGVVDVRTDVYGVGAMLYECLTGNPPFVRGSHLATLHAVVSDPVAVPRVERPDLSRDLEAICLQCLEKDPLARYQTMGELISDLERFLAGEEVEARALGTLEGALRTVGRNAMLVATTAVLTLAFALMGLALVLPALQARREVQLEEQTSAWREARLAKLAAEADGAYGERITELARDLRWDAFGAAAREALAPKGRPGRVEAVERGLGSRILFEAAVAPTVAALRLRQATDEDRFARLAEAFVADPDGPAGRRARLELAHALAASNGSAARGLAEESLLRLIAKDDSVGALARLALARFRTDERDFDEVAALAASVQGAEALSEEERAEADLLAELAATLRPKTRLPNHQFAAVVEHEGQPKLALGRATRIDLYALNDVSDGKLPEPHRTWRHSSAERMAFLARGPSGALMAVSANAKTVHVFQVNLDTPSDTNPLIEIKTMPSAGSVAAIAVGDANGDGVDDLLVA